MPNYIIAHRTLAHSLFRGTGDLRIGFDEGWLVRYGAGDSYLMRKIWMPLTFLLLLLLLHRAKVKVDERLLVLARNYGTSSGAVYSEIYLALWKLEGVASGGGKNATAKEEIKVHIQALGVMADCSKQTRASFSDDTKLLAFLDKLDALVVALKEQTEALRVYLDSGSADDLKKANAKKEVSRVLLLSVLSMPADTSREIMP